MKNNIGLTHYRQILSYATAAEMEGWYYGNKPQFEKRHKQILEFLYEAIDKLELKQIEKEKPCK